MILDRRVCFGISHAHLDTAKEILLVTTVLLQGLSVIKRAPENANTNTKKMQVNMWTQMQLFDCIPLCTSHYFSPLLMTDWYFREEITNIFQSHSLWLNTYGWPALLGLTFNI